MTRPDGPHRLFALDAALRQQQPLEPVFRGAAGRGWRWFLLTASRSTTCGALEELREQGFDSLEANDRGKTRGLPVLSGPPAHPTQVHHDPVHERCLFSITAGGNYRLTAEDGAAIWSGSLTVATGTRSAENTTWRLAAAPPEKARDVPPEAPMLPEEIQSPDGTAKAEEQQWAVPEWGLAVRFRRNVWPCLLIVTSMENYA